jgi:hypothetical protein
MDQEQANPIRGLAARLPATIIHRHVLACLVGGKNPRQKMQTSLYPPATGMDSPGTGTPIWLDNSFYICLNYAGQRDFFCCVYAIVGQSTDLHFFN